MSAAGTLPIQQQPAPPLPAQDDSRLQEYEARLQALGAEVTRLTTELKSSQDAQRSTAEELERVRKDQDDLLELLADQVCGGFVSFYYLNVYVCEVVKGLLNKLSDARLNYTVRFGDNWVRPLYVFRWTV